LTTMASLIALAGGFSVQVANAYFGGSSAHLRRSLAGNSVALAILFGALGSGFVTAMIRVVPAIGGHVGAGTRWIALAAPPIVILGTYLTVLAQSDYRFGVTNITWILAPAVNAFGNGAAAAIGVLSVRTAISTWVAGQVIGTGVLIWYTAKRFSGFSLPDAPLARRMVGFGLKTHAGQIGMAGNYRLDQWILGSVSGNRQLGLYSVAVSWAEILFFLPTVIVSVLRPDHVRASRDEASRKAAAALRAVLLMTLGGGFVMIAAAPILCTTIFGSAFAGSVRDLRILALGAIGVAVTKLLGNALTTQGKPLLETTAIVISFLVTAVADVLLIPPFADVGASIASTISYSAGGVVMVAIFVRWFRFRLIDLLPSTEDVGWLWGKARSRLGSRARTSA
jgi:O-antigen/teichoic acid export membrane protein